MNTYLRFESQSRQTIAQHGINFDWVSGLFLCDADEEYVPSFLEGIPPGQKDFAVRQTLASATSYISLRNNGFGCPDPFSPDKCCKASVCFTVDCQGTLPFAMLPLYYGCRSMTGEEFWICVYGTYGQITQVYFPRRNLVLFDISQANAEAVIESLEEHLGRNSDEIKVQWESAKPEASRCIGMLDMVTNYGHQAINHLSGVERLIELALVDKVDELWVSGVLFFGRIELLYPEFVGRVRYFSDRWKVAAEQLRSGAQLVRIGSTYLSSGTRRRLVQNYLDVRCEDRRHVLVVTVRAGGRRCLNLPEVIESVYKRLMELCDIKIALDGWVLPESALVAASSIGAAVSKEYFNAIRDEFALAKEIENRLPPGSIIVNTIGRSMFESLSDLSPATLYFSHVGTLQHKLGMLLGIPGVVHGPKSQICNPEGGPYLAEEGMPPIFLPENAIEDVPTSSSRGESFSDYRITDSTVAAERLASFIKPAG